MSGKLLVVALIAALAVNTFAANSLIYPLSLSAGVTFTNASNSITTPSVDLSNLPTVTLDTGASITITGSITAGGFSNLNTWNMTIAGQAITLAQNWNTSCTAGTAATNGAFNVTFSDANALPTAVTCPPTAGAYKAVDSFQTKLANVPSTGSALLSITNTGSNGTISTVSGNLPYKPTVVSPVIGTSVAAGSSLSLSAASGLNANGLTVTLVSSSSNCTCTVAGSSTATSGTCAVPASCAVGTYTVKMNLVKGLISLFATTEDALSTVVTAAPNTTTTATGATTVSTGVTSGTQTGGSGAISTGTQTGGVTGQTGGVSTGIQITNTGGGVASGGVTATASTTFIPSTGTFLAPTQQVTAGSSSAAATTQSSGGAVSGQYFPKKSAASSVAASAALILAGLAAVFAL